MQRLFFPFVFICILAGGAVPGWAQVPLSSAVDGSAGGTYHLDGSVVYTGGVTISANTTVVGNGARIDLGAGGQPEIAVQGSAEFTLLNATIEGGTHGVRSTGSGAKLMLENVTILRPTNSGIVVHNAEATLSNVHFEGMTAPRQGSAVAMGHASSVEANGFTAVGGEVGFLSYGMGARSLLLRDGFIGGTISGLGLTGTALELEDVTIENVQSFGLHLTESPLVYNGGTVRNAGDRGMLLLGSPLEISGVTFENCRHAGITSTPHGSGGPHSATVTDCRFTGGQGYHLNGSGWQNLEVSGSEFHGGLRGIVYEKANISVGDCQFAGQRVESISVFDDVNLDLRDCNFADSPIGVGITNFLGFEARNVRMTNVPAGMNVQLPLPGAHMPVIVEDFHTNATGIPRVDKRGGLLLSHVPRAEIRNAYIRAHRIGISIVGGEQEITDSVFMDNWEPGIVSRVQASTTVRNSRFSGQEDDVPQPDGHYGFDLIWTEESDLYVYDSWFFDGPDNCINIGSDGSVETNLVVERCVILGARILGINAQMYGDHMNNTRRERIRDVTALNNRLVNIGSAYTSDIDVAYSIVGNTGAVPISGRVWSEEGKGFGALSTATKFRHNAAVWQMGTGIEGGPINETKGVPAALFENNAIFMSPNTDAFFPTRRGIFMHNSWDNFILRRNYLGGSNPDQPAVIFGPSARPAELRLHHLGEADGYALIGGQGIAYNAPDNYWGAGDGPNINGAVGSGAGVFMPSGSSLQFEPVYWPQPPMEADFTFQTAIGGVPFETSIGIDSETAFPPVHFSGKSLQSFHHLVLGGMYYRDDPMNGVLPPGASPSDVIGWWDIWIDERLMQRKDGEISVELEIPPGVPNGEHVLRTWDEDTESWIVPRQYRRSPDRRRHTVSYAGIERPRTMVIYGSPDIHVSDIVNELLGIPSLPSGSGDEARGNDGVLDAADLIRFR